MATYHKTFYADTAKQVSDLAHDYKAKLDFMCQPYIEGPYWDEQKNQYRATVQYWGLD